MQATLIYSVGKLFREREDLGRKLLQVSLFPSSGGIYLSKYFPRQLSSRLQDKHCALAWRFCCGIFFFFLLSEERPRQRFFIPCGSFAISKHASEPSEKLYWTHLPFLCLINEIMYCWGVHFRLKFLCTFLCTKRKFPLCLEMVWLSPSASVNIFQYSGKFLSQLSSHARGLSILWDRQCFCKGCVQD